MLITVKDPGTRAEAAPTVVSWILHGIALTMRLRSPCLCRSTALRKPSELHPTGIASGRTMGVSSCQVDADITIPSLVISCSLDVRDSTMSDCHTETPS